MSQLDWFPFWPERWFSSQNVTTMTPEQEGAYLRLLCHQWTDPTGSLPDNDIALGVLSRLLDRFKEVGGVVKQCFDAHPTLPGRIVNKRLNIIRREQEQRHKIRVSAGSAGGKAGKHCLSNAQAMLKQCRAEVDVDVDIYNKQKQLHTKDTKIAPKAHALRATSYPWKNDPNFLTFVNSYPKRMRFGIDRAWEQWKMLMPDGSMRSVITDALSRWIRSDQWRREDGQAIPRMDNFLRGRYWEADPLARPRDTGVVVHAVSPSNGSGTK